MSRRMIRIMVALVILAILSVAGYFGLAQYRGQRALIRADEAYAAERWREAKMNYAWYNVRHPGDTDVLQKYIESCMKLLDNRRAHIRDAGRAYLRLALDAREDRDRAETLVDYYREYQLWRELEYATGIFLRGDESDPYLLFNRAVAANKLGRKQVAIDIYQQLLTNEKTNPEVYGNLAILLHQLDQHEQALKVLDDALTEHPDEPLIRVERARYFVVARKFADAEAEVDIALSSGVETGELHLTASRIYLAQSDPEKALDYARKAVQEISGIAEAHLQLVTCLMVGEREDEAIEYLAKLDPYILADNPILYLTLTEIQIDADQIDEARESMEAYKRTYPSNSSVMEYLDARILLKFGKADEAVQKMEVVVQQNPDLQAAQYALGVAYLQNNQLVKARNTIELYLRNNPTDARARHIWNSQFAQRTMEEVENSAFGLLDSKTPYFRSLISTAQTLASNNSGEEQDSERAALLERLLERAIEESPTSPNAYRDLGFHYLSQEDYDGVQRVLDEADAANVAPLELNLLRAKLLLQGSSPDAARALLDEELENGAIAPARVLSWATLYADAGWPASGFELFETMRNRTSDEDFRTELDLESIRFYIYTDDLAGAKSKIDLLAENGSRESNLTTALNDRRLEIARMVLMEDSETESVDMDALLEAVEETEPGRSDAILIRIRSILQSDPVDLGLASSLCASARDLAEPDAETYLLSSEVAYLSGLYDDALDYSQQAYELYPESVNINLSLARVQMQLNLLNDAIPVLERIVSRIPENRTANSLLARAYAGVGRFRDTEEVITRLEKMNEGKIQVSLRAWLLISRGRWADAERLLSKMQEADLDDMWTIHYLIVAMENQGKLSEAETFLNETVERRPDLPELWIELGNLYLRNTEDLDNSKASFSFTKAIARKPGDARAIRGLLQVQLRMGKMGEALALCQRLLNDNPEDTELLHQKALILSRIPGREVGAFATVQEAIEIRPLPKFFYLRGTLRLWEGDYANGIEDFQRVYNAGGGGFADLDLLMAESYLELENFRLAKSFYESAKSKMSTADGAVESRLELIASRLSEEVVQP